MLEESIKELEQEEEERKKEESSATSEVPEVTLRRGGGRKWGIWAEAPVLPRRLACKRSALGQLETRRRWTERPRIDGNHLFPAVDGAVETHTTHPDCCPFLVLWCPLLLTPPVLCLGRVSFVFLSSPFLLLRERVLGKSGTSSWSQAGGGRLPGESSGLSGKQAWSKAGRSRGGSLGPATETS